ncbi:M23 family metallopeptidase [Microbacterium sp. HA-8]|uniref:M23 family metallopeptidase n=1 Tax=Microbacterium sp. HA-8 TaxID=3234200 RepID=UPI0038F7D0A8
MPRLTRPAPKDHHSGFSRTNPRHLGLDYGWGAGDAVTAALSGTVVSVYGGGGYNGGWGNFALIDHGAGVYTGYAHLASGTIAVKVGQHVATGQRLGTMGATGKVSAKHLHFELRIGGSGESFRVDPAPYFTRDLPGLGAPAAAPASTGRADRVVRQGVGSGGYLNGRTQPNTGSKIAQKLSGNVTGTFDGFIRGQQVTVDGVTSNVWYRGAFNGNFFAAAGFTSQSTDGLADLGTAAAPAPAPAPAPAARRYVRLATSWFVFPSAAAARAAKRGHTGPTVARGDHLILEGSGPYRIASGWIGTGRTNPPTITK